MKERYSKQAVSALKAAEKTAEADCRSGKRCRCILRQTLLDHQPAGSRQTSGRCRTAQPENR